MHGSCEEVREKDRKAEEQRKKRRKKSPKKFQIHVNQKVNKNRINCNEKKIQEMHGLYSDAKIVDVKLSTEKLQRQKTIRSI